MAKSNNKIEDKKRLTVGEQMIADEDVIERATDVATERIESMNEASMVSDLEDAYKYSVMILEKFVGRSPSQLGIKPWLIGEYAIELVVRRRVLEHLTTKPKS